MCYRSSPSAITTAATPNSSKVLPPANPQRAGSSLSATPLNPNPLSDEIRVYEVEDTPVDLSETSSVFSDLTVDDPQGSGGRISVDSNDGLIQHFPEEGNPSQQSQR